MKHWIRKSLGRQILAGYAGLCGVVLVFGLYAFYSVHKSARHIEHMTENLGHSIDLAMDIAHNTTVLRQSALGYVRGRRQEDLNAFLQTSRLLKENLNTARDRQAAMENLGLVERVQASISRFEDVFKDVIPAVQRIQDWTLKDLNHHKYVIEDGLSALRVLLVSTQDVAALLLLESTARNFLEIQMHGLRFIETGDEKHYVLLEKATNGAQQQIVALRGRLSEDPESLNSVEKGLQVYGDIIGRIRLEMRSLKSMVDNLIRLEDAIREDTTTMTKSLEAILHAYRDESKKQSVHTGLAVVVFAVLAVFGGGVVGFFHTRRLTNPLQRVMMTSQQIALKDLQNLIDQLRRLSRGDLNVDFSVSAESLQLKRADEVGVMAAAFDTIIEQLHEARGAFQDMRQYLQTTASTAKYIAGGIFDHDIQLASEDDALGKVLQHMLDSLRHAEHEAARHQQFLEDQVRERTKELEERRRMLWTLMGNLQGMVYRCRNDRHWTMEFVSEGAFALTGYHPEELVASQTISYGELIHPEDRESVWNDAQEALSERRPFILLYRIRTKDDKEKWVWEKGRGVFSDDGVLLALEGFITDITVLKRLQEEREQLIANLQKALSEVKTLSGLLPICSSCKKIRDDQGYWEQLESYFRRHSDILFTHGICPECMKNLYPDVYEKMQKRKAGQVE